MKKNICISVALALVFVTAIPDAQARCKPPEDVAAGNSAQPLRDCPSTSQSVFERIVDLFRTFD